MRLCHCVDAATTMIGPDCEISGISADSRDISAGMVFAALKGLQHDGYVHIDQAISRGAAAILSDARLADREMAVTRLISPSPRASLARLAANFWPNRPERVAAVTGTNGKSSTVEFLRQLWAMRGLNAASLGTLGLTSRSRVIDESLTTPDPVSLHQWLDQLARAGCNHLALEASSHGLDQARLDGLNLDAAAFTNLSRDHLDYHSTEESYFEAKCRLFDPLLAETGTAILNADDPRSAEIKARLKPSQHCITFGRQANDLILRKQTPTHTGQEIEIDWQGQRYVIESPLIGSFQAMNLLTAAGLAIATGLDAQTVIADLAGIQGARGRMEKAAVTARGAAIYVDYAHTPDALGRAISDLRGHVRGRLIVLFGCGGDRDAGKRPQMAAMAQRHADIAILTDDNPRSEDPASIRAQAKAGAPDAVEIGDRATAIAEGIAMLEADDVLLIAGKGHEQGQIVGDQRLPFDDVAVAQAALRDHEAAA